MPWRNDNFWTHLYQFITAHSAVIFGFFLAVLVSIFSTAKKHGKVDWLEALICGSLTVAISSLLSHFNLPYQFAIFLGGFIGFKGSLWLEEKFNHEFHKRFPPSEQEKKHGTTRNPNDHE